MSDKYEAAHADGGPTDFASFFPYYLREHVHPFCRSLHYLGTTLVIALAAYALGTGHLVYLWALPVVGYFFAWVGHFFIEKNKPATFTYPLWSLIGDFKMYFLFITGRIGPALDAAGARKR
ncbi:DUF962 domain-containing protein [Alphaproteobacteria bacterium]|nr:DUF962 domain-containing protein [Alphaproteobacteria bacterium]